MPEGDGACRERAPGCKALGTLDRAAGLVLSKPEFVGDEGAPFGLDALLLEGVGTRKLPVAVDFDAGHTVPMLALA